MEVEPVWKEFFKRGGGAQSQRHAAGHIAARLALHRRDGKRQHRDVTHRAVNTGNAADRLRGELRAARDEQRLRKARTQREAHDGHRRHGHHRLREDLAQQRLYKLRRSLVEPLVYLGAQIGRPFEYPLGVRVAALFEQHRSRRGIFARKLPRPFVEHSQLFLKVFVHVRLSSRYIAELSCHNYRKATQGLSFSV